MKILKSSTLTADTFVVCMYDCTDIKEGVRMQKKPAKDLFIDSSCRRTGLLKTLLQGHRHKQGQDASGDGPAAHGDCALLSPGMMGFKDESDKSPMQKAVSL
jgi:hypothetical protein